MRLFLGHIERYHYLSVLGEDPPEDQSLTTSTGPAKQEMMADEEDCLMDMEMLKDQIEEDPEKEQEEEALGDESGMYCSTLTHRTD